jgi:hypothetical protein
MFVVPYFSQSYKFLTTLQNTDFNSFVSHLCWRAKFGAEYCRAQENAENRHKYLCSGTVSRRFVLEAIIIGTWFNEEKIRMRVFWVLFSTLIRIYPFQLYFCPTIFPRSLHQIWLIYLHCCWSCVFSVDISRCHVFSATLSQLLQLSIVFNFVAFKIFFSHEDTYQILGDTWTRDDHSQSIFFSCEFIGDLNVYSKWTSQFL